MLEELILGASGTSTAAIAFGGSNPPTYPVAALTEDWNGVSWQETADMNTARTSTGTGATSVSALASAGGPYPSASALTEEWNVPGNVVKTLTD